MANAVDNSSTSIIIFGARGRMGTRIAALAEADGSFVVRGLVDRHAGADEGAKSPANRARGDSARGEKSRKNAEKSGVLADVVIDFSSDEGALESLSLAERARSALLVGTTALSPATMKTLRRASASMAILVSPNTSLGVAVLSVLVRDACRMLGADYHASIVEAHHIAKKDAPSGTALRLAAAARDAGHALRDDQIVAIRGGDVVGEHTIRLAGQGEYIELTHRATTRDLFARGALRCAAWLKGKPAGWYTMQDVVGLSA
jgi:4-hydroxy-tetrahydrodipicolinate reductase